jgi:hypothetical protein
LYGGRLLTNVDSVKEAFTMGFDMAKPADAVSVFRRKFLREIIGSTTNCLL